MDFSKRYKGGRPKADFRTASVETYKQFCLENPAITITFKEYETIIRKLNLTYLLRILETGHIIKLPFGLGYLTINKKKPKRIFTDEKGTHILLPVNWDETHKQDKLVYHFNDNTDGYNCHWCWLKYNSKIRMTNIWELRVCKLGKNLLKDFLCNRGKEYFQRYNSFNTIKKRRYKY